MTLYPCAECGKHVPYTFGGVGECCIPRECDRCCEEFHPNDLECPWDTTYGDNGDRVCGPCAEDIREAAYEMRFA